MAGGKFNLRIDNRGALLQFDKRQLKKIMRQAGQEVSATAKALMRSSGGGRKYGSHIASAPGQAPSPQTKALIRGIKISTFRSGLGVVVTSTAQDAKGRPYGLFLESGAQYQTSPINRPKRVHRRRLTAVSAKVGRTTILPRPYLSAALAQRAVGLNARIGAAVQQGIAFKKEKP